MIPRFVEQARCQGFKKTHKGALMQIPRPATENVPIYMLAMVAIEAVLKFFFWTMQSPDSDYGMKECRDWPHEASMEYKGKGLYGYGHSPLYESIVGDFYLYLFSEKLGGIWLIHLLCTAELSKSGMHLLCLKLTVLNP
jgi:hypothetical protein